MIGCLTETTTCVVAKPLVFIKLNENIVKYSNYIAYLSSKAIECQLTSQKQLLHNHLEQLNKESEIPLDLAKICPDKGVLAITNWQNALAFASSASSNDLLAY